MLAAIKAHDAGLAEKAIRAEVTKAAAEVTRLLGSGNSAGPGNAVRKS
jgi:hypothetical protein